MIHGKMTREAFVQEIIKSVKKHYEKLSVTAKEMVYRNDTVDTALLLKEEGKDTICLYLNAVYEDCIQNRSSIKETVKEICSLYEEKKAGRVPPDMDFVADKDSVPFLNDRKKLLSHVCVELVCRAWNHQFLQGKISHPVTDDLAAVYYLCVDEEKRTEGIYLTKQMQETIGVSEEFLFLSALINTRRFFPPQIRLLSESDAKGETWKSQLKKITKADEAFWLGVLGEKKGSVAMCYPRVLSDIYKKLHPNHLYLLPVSADEIIVVPQYEEREGIKDVLGVFVQEENRRSYLRTKPLSSCLYEYMDEDGEIKVVRFDDAPFWNA